MNELCRPSLHCIADEQASTRTVYISFHLHFNKITDKTLLHKNNES